MPGSVNGAPSGRRWLISFFKMLVAKVATMEPSTMNGATKSRRYQTAAVWAKTTSHLVDELSVRTAERGCSEARTAWRAVRGSGGELQANGRESG